MSNLALQNTGKQVVFTQQKKIKMQHPSIREGNCVLEKSVGRKGRSDLALLWCLWDGTVATSGSLWGAWQSLDHLPSVFHCSDIQALSGECYDSFAPSLLFTFARLSSIKLSVFYFTLQEDKSQGWVSSLEIYLTNLELVWTGVCFPIMLPLGLVFSRHLSRL